MRRINHNIVKCTILFICILLTLSCGSPRYISINSSSTDTLYVSKTEIIRDTVILQQLPQESFYITTKDTTSFLETSVALSSASITNGMLQHSLSNKPDSIKFIVKYKDRETIKTETQIVEKEIPVEVVKEKKVIPKWCWCLLSIDILLLFLLVVKLYLKFIK